MNNCLVLGAGRSGTSLTALLLERSGYHVYKTTYQADEGNPLGYFEDLDVIGTNEAILARTYRSVRVRFSRAISGKPNVTGTKSWLAWLLDLDPQCLAGISLHPDHAHKFRDLFSHTPFAYKDPRFSFTLRALAPVIPENTSYVCVFRHPRQVVESTRKHASRNAIVADDAYFFGVWESHYRCLLKHYTELGGQWLFVSYEHLIDGHAVPRIEEFLKIQVDRTLIKKELNRADGYGAIPDSIAKLFERLTELEGTGSDDRYKDLRARVSPSSSLR